MRKTLLERQIVGNCAGTGFPVAQWRLITRLLVLPRFGWLNITPGHAQAVLDLAAHHKDPFDRLLIAQAQCAGMCMVTDDRLFQDDLPDTLLVRTG
jgi:PIN domain nuclease of toxin-antitoxin system